MSKIKVSLILVVSLLVSNFLKAQSLEEGKKLMYYEKYKSARNVFEKLVAANPTDEAAVYWLGQSLILPETNNDIAGAKTLYQKSLAANPNSALLLAGMGHIELLEGKTQDARNRFETAISLSQGKSIPVLNAIGFANVHAKQGDAAYARDKLRQATTLKGFKDPDVYCNLGDAYRKFADGGNALQAYEAALKIDPNYARASYRIGKIYLTQGFVQEDIYMKYFNEAIAKDPAYAPVYEDLYELFYNTNVSKSAEYLDKYLAAKGNDEPNACYYRASMRYAQGAFAEAVTEVDKCIAAAGTSQPFPNLYGLKGYAYNRLGDSLNAKAAFDLYFQKQNPDKIGPTDYTTYVSVLLKFPGNEEQAGKYVDKAVALDSTEAGKVNQLKTIASAYESRKLYKEAGDWYKKILNIKKNPTKTDIYNAGYGYYRSGNFDSSASMFNLYTQKFPDDIFGYYMMGKSYWGIDTTMEKGLANAAFEKAIQVGEAITDTVLKAKVKNQLIGSYKYMIAYAANIKKDKAEALAYCDKVLAIDPADEETIRNREAIASLKPNGNGNSKSSGTGKSTGGSKPSGSSGKVSKKGAKAK
jgi:tetratricopeptide (TPR) repeat protein